MYKVAPKLSDSILLPSVPMSASSLPADTAKPISLSCLYSLSIPIVILELLNLRDGDDDEALIEPTNT